MFTGMKVLCLLIILSLFVYIVHDNSVGALSADRMVIIWSFFGFLRATLSSALSWF